MEKHAWMRNPEDLSKPQPHIFFNDHETLGDHMK